MTDWLPNCFTWNAGCESLISSWTGGALCAAWTDAGCVAIKTSHPGLYTGLVVVGAAAGGVLVIATCVATCPAITIAAGGGGGAALTTGGTVGSGATIAITVSSEVLAANAGLLTSYGLYMAADGSASGGGGSHAPRDYSDRNTNNWSAQFRSEREARAFAREKLGRDPFEAGANKLRSADGRWQYRAKPSDVVDRHIHLEQLDPSTGRVIQNVHLRW